MVLTSSVETKEDLFSVLNALCAPLEDMSNPRRLLDNWEDIDKDNEMLMSNYLSEHIFEGRDVICFNERDFWVYADSREDAQSIKEQADKLGFKNMYTFVPMKGSELDPKISIPDPNHAFAVSIKDSTSLIFGSLSEQMLKLYKPMMSAVEQNITYIYCYNNDLKITFNCKVAAYAFHQAVNTLYEETKELAKQQSKSIPNQDLLIREDSLDTWSVAIMLHA
ncbi:hypothetical protein FG475_18995 [Vibrio navarrensis]|nr:hypothetical protein [Vibrio navarrensis]